MNRGFLAMLIALGLVVAGGLGWGAAVLFGDQGQQDVVVAPPTPAESSAPASAAPSAPSPTDSPNQATPSPTATLPSDPAEALDQVAAADRAEAVDSLEGAWVTQLSSKRVGLKAEGKTWTAQDILDEHQALRGMYPDARLVWSGDFASFKEKDFWVTIIGLGHHTPEAALDWCVENGLGPDHCYAKQLNTTGGHEGTTRLQD